MTAVVYISFNTSHEQPNQDGMILLAALLVESTMVELSEHVLEIVGHKGHSVSTEDLLGHLECYHSHDEPGLTREVLEAYGEAIERDGRVPFTATALLKVIDSRLTDSATCIEGAFYEVAPDRVSGFPVRWHEQLDGETDVREYLRFIQSDASGYRGDAGEDLHAAGVPKSLLRAAVAVLGGQYYGEVDQQINDLRQQGEVAAYPDQHPNADIQLRE